MTPDEKRRKARAVQLRAQIAELAAGKRGLSSGPPSPREFTEQKLAARKKKRRAKPKRT
jgi:hypothetical protein